MYISANQTEALMYLNLKTFYHLDSFLSSKATANMFEKVSLAMKNNDLPLLQDLHSKYLEKIRAFTPLSSKDIFGLLERKSLLRNLSQTFIFQKLPLGLILRSQLLLCDKVF